MYSGKIQLEISGADIPGTINHCNREGLEILEIISSGVISAKITIYAAEQGRFFQVAEKFGNEVVVCSRSELGHFVGKIRESIVLILASVLISVLTIWIPGRILFVCVEGNRNISTEQILYHAEQCGIYFGAERKLVRSSVTKNRLIEKLPQLQWVGVNSIGCCAVIRVCEKEIDRSISPKVKLSNISASSDGVITALTVTAGLPACAVGDAVKKGQVLITGYQNLGDIVKLQRASGEVYAKTVRRFHLVAPCSTRKSKDTIGDVEIYSLIIGKKRVNLLNSSGISYVGCDRIKKEYTLMMPGGFCLPVSLVRERCFDNRSNCTDARIISEDVLLDAADSYLLSNMVSGRILDRQWVTVLKNETADITVVYNCIEMIGIEQAEEFRIEHGKDD